MAENEILEPGSPIAASEEALAGDGTYDDGQDIRSARYGRLVIDRDLNATVQSINEPAKIQRGDIVIGRLSYVREEFASVTIMAVRGKEDRRFHHPVEATLHVSKTDEGYVRTIDEKFRVGDIIRAKVINLKGGPQLATDKSDLGVVKAINPENGVELKATQDWNLRCPETGRIFDRKIANDYGSGKI